MVGRGTIQRLFTARPALIHGIQTKRVCEWGTLFGTSSQYHGRYSSCRARLVLGSIVCEIWKSPCYYLDSWDVEQSRILGQLAWTVEVSIT